MMHAHDVLNQFSVSISFRSLDGIAVRCCLVEKRFVRDVTGLLSRVAVHKEPVTQVADFLEAAFKS